MFVLHASHFRQRVSPVKDMDGRPIVVLTARRWPEEDDEWLHMLIYALEVSDPSCRTVSDLFGDDIRHNVLDVKCGEGQVLTPDLFSFLSRSVGRSVFWSVGRLGMLCCMVRPVICRVHPVLDWTFL